MRVEKTICDRKGCGKDDAVTFHLFKERRADGAGSMEDWDYQFDLCSNCSRVLLTAILETFGKFTHNLEKAEVLTYVNKFQITTREG